MKTEFLKEMFKLFRVYQYTLIVLNTWYVIFFII